ncbi:MAG TPA: AfsR/SARP family transcriptional regulator [Micromonosporaceae bacterium]
MSLGFRLLGTVELTRSGDPVPFGPAKARALLAALVFEPNRLVPLSRLIEAVWSGPPPRSAVANLRTYAHGLRRAVADRLTSRSGAYKLTVKPGEADVDVFRTLVENGRSALRAGDADRSVQAIEEALRLWRGPAGHGLPTGTSLDPHFAALTNERLNAMEDLVDARLALGDHARVLAGISALLAHHPLRERAWGQLMLALYRSGDVAGALAAYADARKTIREQLGIEPAPQLATLHRAILDHRVESRPAPAWTATGTGTGSNP